MGALLLGLGAATSFATAAEPEPVYELRIYTCNEGRLPALLARFRDHTCALFEKHGMTNIGYWVPTHDEDGAQTKLIYLLRHASRDAAKASFKAFGQDPEWQAAREASERDGKILAHAPESIFLTRTDFSPEVVLKQETPHRTFELRTYTTPEGKLEALHRRFRDHTCALFAKHGMTQVGYWDPMDAEDGAGSKLIYLLAHASEEAAKASFAAFREDPDWIAAKTASEADGSLTVPKGVQSVFLRPTDFSPLQ
ncbi:MAG: NIPSNAP family protein [Verrucomicrobiales bacterium]|nr:NIPSNAP family protein [Verrucomicrobiales bacterium]